MCNGLALVGVGMKVQDGRRRSEGQAHRQFPPIWDKLFFSKEIELLMSTESVNRSKALEKMPCGQRPRV